MKNFLPALLPTLALLTLGGCVGTSALTSTETDGVYYSSKDKTTLVASAAPASYEEGGYEATTDEAANPDYNEGAASSNVRSGSDEYYDEDYGYSTRIRRFHQPYRGTGLGYYDLAYTDPFWYGSNAYYGAYSPYGGFYDPFYNPYAFGGGSFINIGLGFGNPWARPWRYGYGGGYGLGYYDGFNNGFYGGLRGYGYGGLGYGGLGYGNVYNRNYTDNRRSNVNVAPRRDRSSQAYNLDRPTNSGPVMSTRSRGGNVIDGSAAPAPTTAGRGRGRVLNASGSDSPQPTAQPSQPGVVTESATSASQPRRWRTVDPANNAGTASPAEPTRTFPSRREMRNAPREQVSRPERSESSRSERSTRTYSQPSRSESYSQPSRSESYSSPSMSSPSPSNSGDSNSGGSRGRIR
ncbi:hypothetical protein H8B13_16270 [Hymenobacter sp. BT188]|uniref:hypothetical protein n=1 Tax=Hymenobacter sp. BT188 TaxID=2763504 RepID=UPI00165121F3|nr:hypothetical protein [Hymenobacter sp. BT188]MBC6608383.1 hypothetical protein [Hymenobacter sp. BT188]